MSTAAEPLIQYLRQLESQGQTHVSIDDESRKILRAFYIRARAGTPAKQARAPKGSKPAVARPTDEPTSTRAQVPALVVTGNTPAEKIDSLKRQVTRWAPVLAQKDLRKTMVFSVGNPSADVMLVGEAPGYDEERLGEPFVGKAGQKLDGILKAMGIDRRSVYISNIVKFRPAMPNQTTNNRKPTKEEMDACLPFIHEEVKVVAPKVIIALGGTAAQALLNCDQPVGSMRGCFHDYAGIPLRVTYHPSYILHNEATSEKRKLWEDMLAVMDLLRMPISEKQRGYFLTN
ncbi:MAG: uracil-DNA glycosylase [Akkermansiaceae bacterium]|nr:uracil-DNA glycosylase [Akkermansiaceae bacterium]